MFNTLITKTFVRRDINEVCDILRNLSPLLVGRGTEVLKDHVYQKYIFSFDESKVK